MQVLLAAPGFRDVLAFSGAMATAGITVDHASGNTVAMQRLKDGCYNAVVLQGTELLHRMRAAEIATPALVLATTTDPARRIQALRTGADDVVDADLDREEMAARLHAIARRDRTGTSSIIALDEMTIDLHTHAVTCGNTPVLLTGKEFEILRILAQRRGAVLTKDALLAQLYGGRDEPEGKIIDVFVCKLRRKLQDAGMSDVIVTVWGRGYMLRDRHTETAVAPARAKPLPVPQPA